MRVGEGCKPTRIRIHWWSTLEFYPLSTDNTGKDKEKCNASTKNTTHERISLDTTIDVDQIGRKYGRCKQTNECTGFTNGDYLDPLMVVIRQFCAEAIVGNGTNCPDEVCQHIKAQHVDYIGGYGTQGGGAAGEEIDRYDVGLGSPEHAIVVASSEDHKPGMLRAKEEFHMTVQVTPSGSVRSDITFFETPSGGAVFSTGSISYAGSLSINEYTNDIARLTGNVLTRFLDPARFDYPS